jgi:hypothetical protein
VRHPAERQTVGRSALWQEQLIAQGLGARRSASRQTET